ncbi:MAG TPA: permease prefix domain 1-containing protein [Bryobacteraceae bacterium]
MFFRRRKSRDDDLDRELRSHLDLEAEEQQESGVSPEEARYAAKRALGNASSSKKTSAPPGAGTPPSGSGTTCAIPFALSEKALVSR